MSNECACEAELGGQTYTFNLGHPWVRNVLSYVGLPGEFGSTPVACLRRFDASIYSTDDVERVIELGLIGGGITRSEASKIVDQHVRRSPIAAHLPVAVKILLALFNGAERADDDASA